MTGCLPSILLTHGYRLYNRHSGFLQRQRGGKDEWCWSSPHKRPRVDRNGAGGSGKQPRSLRLFELFEELLFILPDVNELVPEGVQLGPFGVDQGANACMSVC